MVDATLLETLELLTPPEQKALLAVAEFLKSRREDDTNAQALAEALLAEGEPGFQTPDDDLTPARMAARRFMRKNPTLMRLLAQ